MDLTAFFQSMPEYTAVYTALTLLTSAVLFVVLYVRQKFARANGALRSLTREWTDAENRFFEIADVARQQISELEAPAPVEKRVPESRPANDGAGPVADVRTRVVAMGKQGMTTEAIAAACGLGEAEVDVLVGMHRIAQGRK